MPHLLILLNLLLSALLTGLIWFVQVVHYPIFRRVGRNDFIGFQQAHQYTTGLVVGLPMAVEFVLSLVLIAHRLPGKGAWLGYGAGLCVLVVWGVTFLVSVPIHSQLVGRGFDAELINRLVGSNWLRTVAWTVRTGLLAYLLWWSIQ